MNILFASAEMSPLAKVGGLGDVAGSLPRALRGEGHDVRIAMPFYGTIARDGAFAFEHILEDVEVAWPGGAQYVDVWRTTVHGVPVYLFDVARLFGRPTVYGFEDDGERFLFFCDAMLAAAPFLDFEPDVVHAQDWHSALLLTRLAGNPDHRWGRCGRVYTIHNLALQGAFTAEFAAAHGIDALLLAPPAGLPPATVMSAMAQGILHADRVNTVSDTYAQEIMTLEYGAGLDPLLRARAGVVSGIVNGINVDEFDPLTDPALATHFDADTLDARAANKRALQQQAELPDDADSLLFGVVTRLFAQKGIDLVGAAFDALLAARNMQLIVLGTGDEAVHKTLQALEAKYPQQVKIWLDFNPPLGQQIYGGCDVFLMPSRYEPCGLGQLISLRYGAVPLVRRTGGLADTVQDADASLRSGTGFVFDAATADELAAAAQRALDAFTDREAWRALQQRGMRQDWSWSRAAGKYHDLYEAAANARTAGRTA